MWELMQNPAFWCGWAFGAVAAVSGELVRDGIKILVNAWLRSRGARPLND
jgi:hypothetical protein